MTIKKQPWRTIPLLGGLLAVILFSSPSVFAQGGGEPEKVWTSAEAWAFLPTYQFGDDWAPLLLIEDEVEKSTVSAETQRETAAKLAAYLSDETSYPGRQFVCMQLRLVGGAAEVPALAKYLFVPTDVENARLALEVIDDPASLVPLREALDRFEGDALIGVVNSLAKRKDAESFDKIAALTKSTDLKTADAALYALGRFGDAGAEFLLASDPAPENRTAAEALLNIADGWLDADENGKAKRIFERFALPAAPPGVRKASLKGLLQIMTPAEREDAVTAWIFGDDAERRKIAAERIATLSDAAFDRIAAKKDSLPSAMLDPFYEAAVLRGRTSVLADLTAMMEKGDSVQKASAIRRLGRLDDPSVIPAMVDQLRSEDAAVQSAAMDALLGLPREETAPLLIAAVEKAPAETSEAIDLLARMKWHPAIDPLIALAKNPDASIHNPVLRGLADLADPDSADLPRLVDLYLYASTKGYRDDVERTIVLVCGKEENASDRVFEAAKSLSGGSEIPESTLITILPLLGKLGGEEVYARIEGFKSDSRPAVRQAAVRALCNWPTAEHADELWTLATDAENPAYRRMALRAFIRVQVLENDRPSSEILAQFRKAMPLAAADEDRILIIQRAAEVRTPECIEWIFSFLDDTALTESVSEAVVKMAHHREFRTPNKELIHPMLEKVESVTKDRDLAEAARKARLGM